MRFGPIVVGAIVGVVADRLLGPFVKPHVDRLIDMVKGEPASPAPKSAGPDEPEDAEPGE